MKKRGVLTGMFSCALLLLAFPTSANDSAAGIVAGGIVFQERSDIRLVREDLHLSPEIIKVDYVFENPTGSDVALTMAFPFPETFADDIDNRWPERPESVKFIDFTTTVDGTPVAAQEVIDIISLDGQVITDLFRREGFPIAPYAEAYRVGVFDSDAPRSVAMRKRMAALGLLGNFQSRKWKTRISYVWNTTFPARSRVTVSHSYKPVNGAFLLAFESDHANVGEGFTDWFTGRFCVGDDVLDDLRARPAEKRLGAFAREVGYVLTTGGNWAGPIGALQLTVDIGAAENRIVSCWNDVLKKTGPTTFSFSAVDYTPDRDVVFAVIPP